MAPKETVGAETIRRTEKRRQMLQERDCGYRYRESRDARLSQMVALLRHRHPEIDLTRATAVAEREGRRVDDVLIRLGIISEDEIFRTWTEILRCDVLSEWRCQVRNLIPTEIIHRNYIAFDRFVIFEDDGDGLALISSDPSDDFTPSVVAHLSGKSVRRVLATDRELSAVRRETGLDDIVPSKIIDADPDIGGDVERLRDLASDAPVVRAVSGLIEAAVDRKASDIHVSADDAGWMVRLRIDGSLEIHPTPTVSLAAVVSRLKIMAGLDIGESRLPQDGRVRIPIRGRETDLRIATVPHVRGEGAVIRVLDRSALRLDLDELELTPTERDALGRIVGAPHGLVVVTGPTGSGKTTTLYSLLRALSSPTRNIVTVEDPVEIRLERVVQIQVQPKIGLDFATTLRSVLRQDPDVIMVGEIRDKETAVVANQAALTGHLVVASLHTNTALGAIPRLIDMGIEPYLLASTLKASIAQRLVRRLCVACRRPTNPAGGTWRALAENVDPPLPEPVHLYTPGGCPSCRDTGYRGRFAVFEVVEFNDEIRSVIAGGASETLLERHVDRKAHPALVRNALHAVAEGSTSMDEVIRVLGGG